MKTPRELLLNRHRNAGPALDTIRGQVVRSLGARAEHAVPEASPAGWLNALWQELFVSCRRYWLGLGAAWCAILFLALFTAGERSNHPMMAAGPSEPALHAVREQLRLRAELIGGTTMLERRSAPGEAAPGPRSACRPQILFA